MSRMKRQQMSMNGSYKAAGFIKSIPVWITAVNQTVERKLHVDLRIMLKVSRHLICTNAVKNNRITTLFIFFAVIMEVIEPIKKGSEIDISYIDCDNDLQERQADLKDYGFFCACDRCDAERWYLLIGGSLDRCFAWKLIWSHHAGYVYILALCVHEPFVILWMNLARDHWSILKIVTHCVSDDVSAWSKVWTH